MFVAFRKKKDSVDSRVLCLPAEAFRGLLPFSLLA